jgi:hypothetical protein
MAVDTAVRCTAGRINLNLTQHKDNNCGMLVSFAILIVCAVSNTNPAVFLAAALR